MPNVLEHRTVKGRKAHQCGLCLQDIDKGERHEAQTIVWEGSIETFRSHLYCNAVLNAHYDNWLNDGEGYGQTHFEEDMSEAWGEAERGATRGISYPWLTQGC